MNKKEKQEQEQHEVDKAIAEFLKNGGKITQCEYGVSGRVEGAGYSAWSKKKPTKSPLATSPEEDE